MSREAKMKMKYRIALKVYTLTASFQNINNLLGLHKYSPLSGSITAISGIIPKVPYIILGVIMRCLKM